MSQKEKISGDDLFYIWVKNILAFVTVPKSNFQKYPMPPHFLKDIFLKKIKKALKK